MAARAQVGRQLRQAREHRGLSQTDLAALLGCSQPHLSAIERGARGVSLDHLDRIAAALDCEAVVTLQPVTAGALDLPRAFLCAPGP